MPGYFDCIPACPFHSNTSNPQFKSISQGLIVIDSLDECHGSSIQILHYPCTLGGSLSHPIPTSSRCQLSQPHIRNTFNLLNKSHAFRHSPWMAHMNQQTLTSRSFCEVDSMKSKRNTSLRLIFLSPGRLRREIIDRLVRKSSGQFIYDSWSISILLTISPLWGDWTL